MTTELRAVKLTREHREVETVDGDVIGSWSPRDIAGFTLVFDAGVSRVEGSGVHADNPVFWPPERWAVDPEHDYYLVRVPRKGARR